MKSIVIYDSVYGNTEKVARAIAKGTGGAARPFRQVDKSQLGKYDLVIFGSPTHGGQPTPAFWEFLKSIGSLTGIRVAAFDTRIKASEQAWWLKMIMNIIGYAAPKIAAWARSKGAKIVGQPQGFIVSGKEGPVPSEELLRAEDWASMLAKG